MPRPPIDAYVRWLEQDVIPRATGDFVIGGAAVARRYRADLAAAGTPQADVRCKARIVGGFETASGGRASFGVRLDLPPMEAGA